jgi:SNF2 family DNA or RNA helicase
VLIADEMGLGKTIQAIGLLNALPDPFRVLIICPASLRLNWARECSRWLTRSYETTVVTDGKPVRVLARGPQLVIVNYDRLGKLPALSAASWDVLILDEAHYVKNPDAARSQKVYALAKCARRVVALTGTPILNRPRELQPILAMLDSESWGDFMRYAFRYCDPSQNEYGWDFNGASHLDELQEKLRASVMVRRLKADVLNELPAKRRSFVPLFIKNYRDTTKAAKILDRLQTLAELQALATEIGDAKGAAEYEDETDRQLGVAFTSMSTYRRQLGRAKIPSAIEYILELLESGINKVVVFAHHKDVIEALRTRFGQESVSIDGSTLLAARQRAVDAFQGDPSVHVFVGNILAAGVGITLTAASHVVIVESDWVPANMTQAEDRCHRIGQHDMVQVHLLTVPGSLDEYILEKVVSKQAIADQALDHRPTRKAIEAVSRPAKTGNASPPITVDPALRLALLAGLRAVADNCDGAVKQDGAGFNRVDSSFGQALARRSDLTDRQYHAALKMLRKYKRQVPEEIQALLGWLNPGRTASRPVAKHKKRRPSGQADAPSPAAGQQPGESGR